MSDNNVAHDQEGMNIRQMPTNDPVLPKGSFTIPAAYVQSLVQPALEPFEARLVREVNRLSVWGMSLDSQLNVALDEIERLRALVPEEQRYPKPQPVQ